MRDIKDLDGDLVRVLESDMGSKRGVSFAMATGLQSEGQKQWRGQI
jgi:hypothetical protein